MKRTVALFMLTVLCCAFTFTVSAATDNVIQFTVNGVPFQMVKVEGSKDGSFYIGKTEVTQALWKAVMGNNPSHFKGDQNPVEMVSYEDCEEFIDKLNAISGQQFRIPTLKEWVYAAKGGKYTHGYKYSGSNDMTKVGWCRNNSDKRTHPVAQKAPNELGIYDMSGNVNEWTTEYGEYKGDLFHAPWRLTPGGDYSCEPLLYQVEFTSRGQSIDFPEKRTGLRLVLTKPKPGSYTVGTTANSNSATPKPSDDNILKFSVNGVSFEMIKVTGGSFKMGSNNGEANEKPVHTETLKTFYIGKTEVTEALWQAVMGNHPGYTHSSKAVAGVSWNDCQDFISRLNKLTGKHFRLPTEAEWEYAARGGSRSKGYEYSGSNDINAVAWYSGNKSSERVRRVGLKAPNELGLYDMSGNVWEWCSDASSDNYSSARTGTYRIIRGGGWHIEANRCRVAYRAYSPAESNPPAYGLRLVLQ